MENGRYSEGEKKSRRGTEVAKMDLEWAREDRDKDRETPKFYSLT